MEQTEWQVFVGRFQPPNNGHRDILQLAFSVHPGPFFIGVVWAESTTYTSSKVRVNPKHSLAFHPFSVWERIHMLSLVVASLAPTVEVRVNVVPRFDIPDGIVFRQFMPECYRRWTTNKDAEDEARISRWRNRGENTFLLKLPFHTMSGTDLRENVRSGGQWRPFIPQECWDYFESIGGPARLLAQLHDLEADQSRPASI